MFLHDDKWHGPDVASWMYRLMNDPKYYEQWRFKEAIDDYNVIIAHCQELYDTTPATTAKNLLIRATSLSTLRRAKRDLANILDDYDDFLRYKARTEISE
jgi:hypothetical protein